jgi:hypothetical protein
MSFERLYQFPTKPAPVAADILYVGDSANSFNEVQITIAELIGVYPSLSGIASVVLGDNTFPYVNSSGTYTAGTLTSLALSLLADSTTAAMQTTLGLGSAATLSVPITVPNGGTGLTTVTPFALIAGGGTSTANLQSLAGIGTAGQVLTSNGAGALPTFQTVAASPFIFGAGTPSALGGTGSTADGNYDLTYGQNSHSDSTTTWCFNFGLANTISTSASLSFAFGDGCTIESGATFAFVFGDACESVGSFSFAFGNTAIVNNSGSWVIGDSQANPFSDTTTDQFNSTFAGGHRWFFRTAGVATEAVAIDAAGNLINVRGQADQSALVQIPINAFNLVIENNQKTLILNPAGTLATGTVTTPPNPIDKQEIRVCTSQTITALTVAPSAGQTISNAPTTLLAGTGFSLIYNLATTKWFVLYSDEVGSVVTYPISLSNGGTNANLTASNGGIVYSTGSALAILAGTATAGQILRSGASAAPTWSTSTYPATNAINTLLYASAANVMSALSTGNSGVLVTSSTGVPSILAAGTTGQVLQASTSGTPAFSTATYPLTTTINQILFSSAANTITGLATVTTAVLTTVAGVPTWATGLSLGLGGTNAALTASAGSIVYSTASAMAFNAVGTTGQILQSGGTGAPTWTTTTYPATNAINTLLYASAANVMSALATANNAVLSTGATGVPVMSTTLPSGLSATNLTLTTPTLGAATATTLAFSPTTGGIIGTTVADNAGAGKVGEFISSVVLQASAVAMTTVTAKNITSISLTAGDWDVWGNVSYVISTTCTGVGGWISSTSATYPDDALLSLIGDTAAGTLITGSGMCVPQMRFNLSSTTTIYLTGYSIFSAGTSSGCGGIYARRIR